MKRQIAILAVLATGCDRASPQVDTPGARLEAVALARGLVPDPSRAALTGSWANDTDRLCIAPGKDGERLGVSIDYGDGQGCAAAGTVERRSAGLRVSFGDCRFDAAFDGERITFPAALPPACSRLCTGRASLAALAVERLSDSASEAVTLRGPRGQLLCAD